MSTLQEPKLSTIGEIYSASLMASRVKWLKGVCYSSLDLVREKCMGDRMASLWCQGAEVLILLNIKTRARSLYKALRAVMFF